MPYVISDRLLERLERDGIASGELREFAGASFDSSRQFRRFVEQRTTLGDAERDTVMALAEHRALVIDPARFAAFDRRWFSEDQMQAVRRLAGQRFTHRWELAEALAAQSAAWRLRPATLVNKVYNKDLQRKLDWVFRTFRSEP